MCGIAGVIDLENSGRRYDHALGRMLELLRPRGPDGVGTFAGGRVAIGTRRLSIIDAHFGRQPMSNEDGTIHVVFNGEVYSHLELRDRLVALGHRFRSYSDTEVLVHGYEEWGIEGLLRRLNGMFAFAVHDRRAGVTHIARDRMGIKPLVYAEQGGALYFASTIAALIASGSVPAAPDSLAVRLYLQQQFAPGPGTVIRGVRSLPPGSYLSVFGRSVTSPIRYWAAPDVNVDRSERQWRRQLRALVDETVEVRLKADVPVGVFLSGGLDSSILLGLMSRHTPRGIAAFHVRFRDEPDCDESRFARGVAERFGAELHCVDLDPVDAVADFRQAIRQFVQPVGDPACIPTLCLSHEARRYVKVVLSGEGADELFSGYDYYRRVATAPARVIQRVRRLLGGAGKRASSGYPYAMRAGEVEALTPTFAKTPSLGAVVRELESGWMGAARSDALNRAARVDMGGWLVDDLLMKIDGSSMACGLEARVPFLDHRLVEAAIAVPGRMKRNGKTGKVILRESFADMLGADIVAREKHGFNVPLAKWFRSALRPLLDDLVTRLDAVPWLDADEVSRIVGEHLGGRERSRILWALYVLVTWFDALPGPGTGSRVADAADRGVSLGSVVE